MGLVADHGGAMTTTLITGANKGLGYETARRLVAEGHTVFLGSRDPERGHRAAGELGATFVQLDTTDDASVSAAVETIRAAGGLDVLVNNAGIEERAEDNSVIGPADVTADIMREVFDVNVFGTVRVTHACLPLLQASPAPVIVVVSSGLASLSVMSAFDFYPGVAYPASKAALNMVVVQFAKAFPQMRINAVEPGFTKTDLNGNTGTQTVAEGAEVIVRTALLGPDGPTGTYAAAAGPIDW